MVLDVALEDHAPVPVMGFINKLMVMRTNDNQLFLEEFGSIPMTMPHLPADTANLHSNKPKNRYNNILPYDITRVKLKGHDYINANYCSVSFPFNICYKASCVHMYIRMYVCMFLYRVIGKQKPTLQLKVSSEGVCVCGVI